MNFLLTLDDSDLEAGILPEKSVIKCHKLFTIEQSQVLKRFSKINPVKFEESKSVIEKFIQTSL